MYEIELKFAVPAKRRAALEKALKRGSVRVERIQAFYFDTADECLAEHGMALRLRKEGRRWVQTLKAATANSFRRIEDNVSVPAPRGGGPPVLDLARHHTASAGDVLRKMLDSGRAADASAGLSMRGPSGTRNVSAPPLTVSFRSTDSYSPAACAIRQGSAFKVVAEFIVFALPGLRQRQTYPENHEMVSKCSLPYGHRNL